MFINITNESIIHNFFIIFGKERKDRDRSVIGRVISFTFFMNRNNLAIFIA